MRILDRYIIRSFLINYLLALGVLLGVYILLDLIINFDKFTPKDPSLHLSSMGIFLQMIGDIWDYYFYQSFLFFQMVSPIIPTLAAGFTMVRMTRHNELTAMLSSGVSLYRIALPIIICAVLFSGVVVANQELVIPAFADKLLRSHSQTHDTITRNDPLYFVKDTDGSLLVALSYNPDSNPPTMSDVRIIYRDEEGAPIGRVMAKEAHWVENYVDANHVPHKDAWFSSDARQIDDNTGDAVHAVAERVGEFRKQNSALTPEQLGFIYSKKAAEYLSSAKIAELAAKGPAANVPTYQRIMNLRFTQPIMNVIMLLLGIPFLLTRLPSRLITNLFYCVFATAICFVTTFVFFQMSGSAPFQVGPYTFASYLFAWVPVLLFFPVAGYLMGIIKT